MSIVQHLASSLGHADEKPNIALALRIVAERDALAIRELVELFSGKNKALKSDAVKTLYEVGERAPELIAPFAVSFKNLLACPDNRLVWGAMCAIDAIAGVKPEAVYMMLPQIMQAVDKGSVITRDHAVKALVKLAAHERFSKTSVPLLLEHLRTAPVNQLPMYAELVCAVAKGKEATLFITILEARLVDVPQPAKRKRIEKAIQRATKNKV